MEASPTKVINYFNFGTPGPSATYGISYGAAVDFLNRFVHAVVTIDSYPYNNIQLDIP